MLSSKDNVILWNLKRSLANYRPLNVIPIAKDISWTNILLISIHTFLGDGHSLRYVVQNEKYITFLYCYVILFTSITAPAPHPHT